MDKQGYLKLRKSIEFKIEEKYLWRHLLCDLGLLVCAFGFYGQFPDSSLRFAAAPLIAILMFRNFSLMHEAVHGLVSERRFLNELIGVISGALCLLPYEPWKRVHILHHYWSGNFEKDPVMAIVRRFPHLPKPLQTLFSGMWRVWIPSVALLQNSVFWYASTVEFLKAPKSIMNWISILAPLVLLTGIGAFASAEVLLTVLAPALAMYLVMVEIVNMPHHLDLPQQQGDVKFPVWKQYQVARSCIYPQWLARFVVLNFNYHTEHHVFPDAPWYQLEQLHEALKIELKSEYNTDGQFEWMLKHRPEDLGAVLEPTGRMAQENSGSSSRAA